MTCDIQGDIYLVPTGRVAYWTNVKMLLLSLTLAHLKGHFLTMKNEEESFK